MLQYNVFVKNLWQPCCKASLICEIQQAAFEDMAETYQRVRLHPFYLPLCTKDVFHYSCYLWTQNLDIYLLQLPSSLLSSLISSPLSSLLPSPLRCHTLLTCVCALVPSFSLAFDNGSGGCFWLSLFFLFASSLFLHSLEKKELFYLSVYKTCHLFCAKHKMCICRLYWSAWKQRHDWSPLSFWYIYIWNLFILFEVLL